MKNTKLFKYYFCLLLILPLLCISLFPTHNVSHAYNQQSEDITLACVSHYDYVVDITEISEEGIGFMAQVENNSFSPNDIKWYLNGLLLTSGIDENSDIFITVIQDELYNCSALLINYSYYQNITSETIWEIKAQLSSNNYETCIIQFVSDKTTQPPVNEYYQLNVVEGSTYQEIDYTSPVTFQVTSDLNYTILSCEWYQKTYANKYVKMPVSSNSYTFTPTQPGTFTFQVIVNESFVLEQEIVIAYRPLYELKVKCNQVTENSNNLNRYLFSVEGANEYNDLSKINWYIRGIGLVQQGGKSFDFQANQYGSYYVYATYEDKQTNTSLTSEYYPLEISINRTKDILIGCGIAVGVMAIFLVIGIIITVKRDKVY